MASKIVESSGWIVAKESPQGLVMIREVGSEGLVGTIYSAYHWASDARTRMIDNGDLEVDDLLVVHVDVSLSVVYEESASNMEEYFQNSSQVKD